MMPAKNSKGFTLVELMMTITIVVIISGISIAGLVTFSQTQGVEDDSKALLSELRRAYSKTTGVFYPPGCISNLTGYRISIPASSVASKQSSFTVTALCSPADQSESRTNIIRNSYFDNGGVGMSFTLKAGNGQLVPIVPASTPVIITITSTNNSALTKQIEVKDFGVFEIL